MASFDDLAAEQYCYLTTTGRVSGEPRTIEIWFGTEAGVLYMLAGGGEKAHWVRNLRRQPAASIRIAETRFAVAARDVRDGDEDALARRLLLEKYSGSSSGDLTNWGRSALPLAFVRAQPTSNTHE